jgi:hypothetical protein
MPLQSLCSYLQLLTMPTPSLILVPARFKTGKLYTPVATTSGGVVLGASGDFNVTRATTATRFNSAGLIESVASGVPRLDYYTSGGTAGCPALLVEPAATNALSYSEEFDNAAWGKSAMTVSTGTTALFTAPDGTTNADKIIATSGNVAHNINRSGIASAAYTFSVFAKAGEESVISLWLRGASVRAEFNLVSGTVSNITTTSARIENYGNGWYRCTVYDSTAGTTAHVYGRGGAAYAGNGSDGFYLWGAQLETGSVATSYIPTTAGQVTRNADVISVSGAVSGCVGQSEGTVYVEVDYRNVANITMLSVQTASIVSGVVRIETNGNELRCHVRDVSGTIRMDQIITSPTLSTGINKIAVGYSSAASGLCIALNGTVVFTATTAAAFTINPDRILLGSREVSGASQLFFNNRIRAAAIYTTRLTNSELAALTTL